MSMTTMVLVVLVIVATLFLVATLFPRFLFWFAFFFILLWRVVALGWNCVHEGPNWDVIKVYERLQSLDHSTHCWSVLGPVAKALISQCSCLLGPFLGV